MSVEGSASSSDDDEIGKAGVASDPSPAETSRPPQAGEASDPVRPLFLDDGHIPCSSYRNDPNSRSNTPTLRAGSLASAPTASPQDPSEINLSSRLADHLPDEKDTVRVRPPAIASVSADIDTRVEAAGSIFTAIGSAFPDIGPSPNEIGDTIDLESACHPNHMGDASGALLAAFQDFPSNPSSVVTTSSASGESSTPFYVECYGFVDGRWKLFIARLDTGADANIICAHVPKRWGVWDQVEPSSGETIKALNHKIDIIGRLTLKFIIPGRMDGIAKLHFKVIPDDDTIDCLLSGDFVRKKNIQLNPPQTEQLPGTG